MPPEALDALATLYGRATRKYPERNWEKGMRWGRPFGAIMRHAWTFWRGEDYDKETGVHHMICVAWNAMALFTYHRRGIGEDDRARQPTPGH